MSTQLASLDVKNLSGAVATRSDVTTVGAEADAAHNTLVRQGVDQVDVQDTADTRVENGEPIRAFPLEPLVNMLRVQLSQGIADVRGGSRKSIRRLMELSGRGSGAWNLGRSGVGRGRVLLRSGGTRRTTSGPGLSRSRRGSGLRRTLGTVTCDV